MGRSPGMLLFNNIIAAFIIDETKNQTDDASDDKKKYQTTHVGMSMTTRKNCQEG